ncbi:MAG: sigma-70 family RNA polymerase sigma factor [Patescibacteria group bacterium]|jgi:RNA polymerase sigma-70 factor (ECF subfamily)
MDQRDFPQFYQRNVQRIYKFLYYRVGGNKELAQDLTQDVFLKAFQAFDRYDEKISQSSWIYTIARNHLINQIAKNKPTIDLEVIENTIWDTDDWAKRTEIRDDEKHLLEAMKRLPHDDGELLRRKHLEGWTFDELAEQMNTTAGALRVRSSRAIKQLRTMLRP